MLLIFFLYFLYATIFVIGKFAIMVAQPIFLTGMRMTGAGIVSYALHRQFYKTKQFDLMTRFDWLLIVLLALFNVYITNAGEFWSLQYLSASKTSFIYNISPFFVLIFSALMFSEKITWTKVLGMIIGFCSLVPILIDSSSVVDTTRHFGPISVAELIMLSAAAATALGWVLMRFFVHKQIFSPFFLNGISLFLGGLMCLTHAYIFEPRPFIISSSMTEFLICLFSMMIIQNIVAYNLHAHLLKRYSATLVALFSFVMPLFTIILGSVFLSEPITMTFFVCSAGVALGLLVFYLEDLKITYRIGKK